MSERSTQELQEIAKKIRKNILAATTEAGSGHPSSSLSGVEVATMLYFGGVLRHDPKRPEWPDRDRFILSKGHAAPLLYSVLAEAGYFSTDDLLTLRKFGSPLEGHPNMRRLPGVEASTGSLGQGLSIGIGHALAAKVDGKDYRVFVMQGDGETQEGQVWEAKMFAGNQQLDNLTLIIDRNRYQQTGKVVEIEDLDPLADKLTSFKWEVTEIDGHEMDQVSKAFDWARGVSGKPQAILASTKKGRGVSFLEKEGNYHGKPVPKEELEKAFKEIEAGLS
ncbi:MAG: transketolase [Actinobacteria bacterium]|nr:transketolase [Actinomycetota bacterium]